MQNKQQFPKVSKRCISYINSLRNVKNDDINYVWHSLHGAHHRSRNFPKAKICHNKLQFPNFENTVNLIYTVSAMEEMMI